MISLNTFLYVAGEVIPVLEKGIASVATTTGEVANLDPLVTDIRKLVADLKAKVTELEGVTPPNVPVP